MVNATAQGIVGPGAASVAPQETYCRSASLPLLHLLHLMVYAHEYD